MASGIPAFEMVFNLNSTLASVKRDLRYAGTPEGILLEAELLRNLLDHPEQIRGERRAQQRPAIAKRKNHFIQVLDLQAIVERKPKTVRPVKQRQGAQDKKINPRQR